MKCYYRIYEEINSPLVAALALFTLLIKLRVIMWTVMSPLNILKLLGGES